MKTPFKNTHDALIFDMDGTLWDAVPTYTKSWNDYFEANHIDKFFTDEYLMGYMGWEEEPYLAAVLPEYSIYERNKIYKEVINLQYSNIEKHGGRLYDGVVSGLENLSKEYQLFIVSNCAEHTITRFMKWAKIEPFIIDSMAFGLNHRPKSENITYLVTKYQLKNPVYIGDTQGDADQSALVPIPFVYVSYGFGTAADYLQKFDSFNDLTAYYLSLV